MGQFGLTKRQAELLSFIEGRLEEGSCPSFEEMREAAGLASKSGVHRLVTALVERGHLVRLPGRARALAIPGEAGEAHSSKLLRVQHLAKAGLTGTHVSKTAALQQILRVVA